MSRARKAGAAVGRFLGQGLAGSAKAAAAGGVLYFGQKALAQRVTFLQQHPMAGPAGLILLGHIAKKKYPTLGTAAIGAGAYSAALAFDLNRMAQQGGAVQPAPRETGALISPNEIGALIGPGDIRALEFEESAPIMNYGDALSI